MRPALSKHIINAGILPKKKRKSKKLLKDLNIEQIDIRKTEWRKIDGVWQTPQGLSPSDQESMEKVENWVREITRISPAILDQDENKDTDNTSINSDILDNQLSAVEGYKKIEIIESRGTKQEVEIEEPLDQEDHQEPLGIEIEKKPWVPKAKMLVALIFGIVITTMLLIGNNLYNPKQQSILSSQTPSNTQRLGFSSPITIKGLGNIYLYNNEWDPKDPEILAQINPIAVIVTSAYINLKLKEIKYSKKEISTRVSDIDKNKTPLLVIIPEGLESPTNNTKLWVYKSGSILVERTIKDKTTWKVKRIDKDGADKLTAMTSKLPFLEKKQK